MIRTKAAPSLICEELPAVTLPPASKTGLNPARSSLDVPAQVLHLCLLHLVFFFYRFRLKMFALR
jgi:hypothetical protein